jgi:hypothetical protein
MLPPEGRRVPASRYNRTFIPSETSDGFKVTCALTGTPPASKPLALTASQSCLKSAKTSQFPPTSNSVPA